LSWLENIKKRLSSPEDDKTPLHKKIKASEPSSELVGKGPTPPFRTMKEKAKAELDTGIAAYRDLNDEPVMTKSKFKQTVQLAERGSSEAKAILNKLQIGDIKSKDADAQYDRYFTVSKGK
jgi:hypothetical protein